MNTGPDRQPLDEDEAALARRLRALPGGQPSAELDARVLARAHAVLAPPRPVRPWVWGLSTAAVAVLAVGLVWQAGIPPTSEELQYRAPAAPVPEAVEALVEDAAAPTAGSAAATAADAAREQADDRAELRFEAPPPPPPAVQRQRLPPAPEADAVLHDAPAPMVVPAPPPPPAAPAAPPPRAESTPPLGAAAQRKAQEAVPASNQAALVRSYASAPPAEWLRHIQSLERDGRREDARAHLRAFRQRHPDHAIPEALQPLLQDGS